MRNMVGSILDYNPEVEAYRDEMNRIINECYLDFYSLQPWTWAQKTLDTYTNPDCTQTDTQITPRAIAQGFATNTVTSIGLAAGEIGQQFRMGQINGNHEGNYLKITGATNAENNGIYIIDKIDAGARVATLSKQSNNFEKVNWQGNAGVAQTVTATAFQRYLPLPKDCNQILSIGIRNADEAGAGNGSSLGHIYNLTRRRDDELNLRYDLTGTPTEFIVFDQLPNGFQDLTHFVPRAKKDFTVDTVSGGGAGGWPLGTYEFKMAYEFHNVHGELSDPFELVISEAGTVPRFNTIDTTQFGFKGLRKRFFVRYKKVAGLASEHEELYYRDLGAIDFEDLQADDVVSYFRVEDDDTQRDWPQALIQINDISKLRMVPRFYQQIISRMRVRLHPRPTVQTPIQIRYISFPSELVDDHDQPECPIDCHRYIVYRCLEEMLFKHNQDPQSAYYARKAEKELQKIEERYLTQRSAIYIKDSFRNGPMRVRPFRTLTKTVGADGS